MKRNALNIFFIAFLCSESAEAVESENCSKFYSKIVTEEGPTLFIKDLETVTSSLPLDIYFSHPMVAFESDIIHGYEVNDQNWFFNETLIHFGKANHYVKLLFNDSTSRITKLESSSGVLCEEGHEELSSIGPPRELGNVGHEELGNVGNEELGNNGHTRELGNVGHEEMINDVAITEVPNQPVLPPICVNHTEREVDREKLLQRTNKENTGSNYRILIPVLGTFVGYVVELTFTLPIIKIHDLTEGCRATQYDATHWAITRDWTEFGCVKVVDIFFKVLYEKESDVEALVFNGKSLIGQGKSQAIFYNENMRNAINGDCESYLTLTEVPWFGGEIGKRMQFSAQISPSELQIGVVVDFIFDGTISSLAAWEITPEQISGNHWRLHNAGFLVPPNGNATFPFIVRYFKHYHVPIVGIKLNGRVLCGLGRSVFLDSGEGSLPDVEFLAQRKKTVSEVEGLYSSLIVTIIILVLTMAVGVASVAYLLIGKMSAVRRNRKHLCDFPPREVPQELENNDSVASREVFTSHM